MATPPHATTPTLVRTDSGLAIQAGSASPIPIRHIIGIGRNYAEHAKEQAADIPERPMIFTKSPMTAALDGDDIVIPKVCQDREQVDFEAELAVIIGTQPDGRPVRDVSQADALGCIIGYCCGNDVSARWWQKEGSGGQFCRGKSFDTFCPLGPRIATPDQIPDPQALQVTCRVNGQVMQDAPTSQMIFPIARLISDCSQGTTLLPGTVIMSGTPGGVGMARKPPIYLKHGDTVEVEISKIGVLRNKVRME